MRFARAEGIVPAPEPSHALRAVAEEVARARDAFLSGEMTDYELPHEALDRAAAELADLPALPG